MTDYSKIEIDFDELMHETDAAWLLKIGDDEVWFPKSNCDLIESPHRKDSGIICVPEWLAFEKELI